MAKTVLALALGSAAAFSPNAAPRATTVVRSDPNIKTDVGSGWKPESGGFSSTDTPDFFTEESEKLASEAVALPELLNPWQTVARIQCT